MWTSIFEPLPTFGFLDRLGKESEWGKRHALDHHVVGSDASGVVLRVGSAVRNWKPGDRVTVHCNHLDDQDPSAHDDSMLAANQRIWGFESNFGGLADLAVVKANQLMPKPEHLTWEEAAVNGLCASTSYRMLVGRHAAQMKQGDSVFVWGATGGIGAYGIQLVLNGGGTPVGVVSSPERVKLLEAMGCENVIDRAAEGYQFWNDENTQDEGEWRRLGKKVRGLLGEDPQIVFEHPGRSTFGASVFIATRGGTVVTCAATSGFMLEYDNRHLWMKLKRIVSSHFANYQEAWNMNRLIDQGRIQPVMSACYDLDRRRRGGAGRPPATRPRASSPSAASPRRRASASPIPRSASASARTRSPCSSATPGASCERRRHERPAHRDRPRRHRGARTSTPRSRTTRTRSAPRSHHREVVESDGVEEALIKVADSYIQLTAATTPDSPIAKSIEKRGEGLHHVGYRVDDCAAALAAMVAAGATPIDQAPRPGSRGTTVAFVHPKGSFGTLIELVQE